MNPALKHRLASVILTLGLAISLYLALLKLFALPCIGSSSCQAVIHSRFGAVFGVPVGAFGAFLWSGAILVRDTEKRVGLLTLLSLGSLVFMIIQFVVLRGFCAYCTVHAVLSWLALGVHAARPARWLVLPAVALAAGGFALSRAQANAATHAVAATPDLAAALAHEPSALPWLGEIATDSPSLVLSVTCPACFDLLDELSKRRLQDIPTGPAVFFKTDDANRALTVEVVAAVLAQKGPPRREAFLAVASLLLSRRDSALNAPGTAAQEMALFFPNADGFREEAERLLRDQADALRRHALPQTTPLLITRDGQTHAFFKADDLFKR